MSPWFDLYRAQTAARSLLPESQSDIRKVLIDFADRAHSAQTIRGKFQRRERENLTEWHIAAPDSQIEVVFAGFCNVKLQLLALVDKRARQLRQFSATLSGENETTGQPWTAAVHFESNAEGPTSDHKGAGAASHAAFHCHVGPDLDALPKIRVPLPAVSPAEALRWLLSIVDPAMEPAPWPNFA